MPKSNKTYRESRTANQKNKSASTAGLWWICAVGGILLAALFFLSIYLSNLTERVKFFTVNALSVLVMVVIVVQAYIYRKQWDVMENQSHGAMIAERAYLVLKQVGIVNPIKNYTLEIRGSFLNTGRTPARDVESRFQVGLTETHPQDIDWAACKIDAEKLWYVPAGAERVIGFPNVPLTKETFAEFDAGKTSIHLDGEIRFTDYMGNTQVFAFGFTGRAEYNGAFLERYQYQRDADPN